MTERLKELEAIYEAKKAEALRAQLDMINYIVEQSEYKINDTIQFGRDRTIGKIVEIIPFYGMKVKLRVATRNKNSEWSKTTQSIYPDDDCLKLSS